MRSALVPLSDDSVRDLRARHAHRPRVFPDGYGSGCAFQIGTGEGRQLSGSYACAGYQPCSFYSRCLQWFRWRMRLPKAQQDAARYPAPSLAAPSEGDAVQPLVLPPERRWGVTGGIGTIGITGAMVVAGSGHRTDGPIRYRIAIAGERYDCTVVCDSHSGASRSFAVIARVIPRLGSGQHPIS